MPISHLPSIPLPQFFPLLVTLSTITIAHCGFFDGIVNSIKNGACYFKDECCNAHFIPGNMENLHLNLNRQVFGQHIAIDIVAHAISAHWQTPHARKPLVMSFHGHTGSGKNLVSKIIADNLYLKGMKSKYVKLFTPGIDFPEAGNVDQYKRELYALIKERVHDCEKQLFIFDEVDELPAGMIDGIKALLDYHETIHNVDYRRCIFIFLSNIGAQSITSHFLELWRMGRARDDIRLSDFETMISLGAFNANGKDLPSWLRASWYFLKQLYVLIGGFFRSEAISNNLIDHYVPFLPMEREHVERCIMLEFQIRDVPHVDENAVEEVINFIEWGPSPENKFAKTGCKRLSQKVAAIAFKLLNGQRRLKWKDL